MLFRLKRRPAKNAASPFTEMPEELKEPFAFGRYIRGFFSVLFMLLLSLALLGLIAAFAYKLIYDPQSLAEGSSSLINTVQNFLQSLIGGAN